MDAKDLGDPREQFLTAAEEGQNDTIRLMLGINPEYVKVRNFVDCETVHSKNLSVSGSLRGFDELVKGEWAWKRLNCDGGNVVEGRGARRTDSIDTRNQYGVC